MLIEKLGNKCVNCGNTDVRVLQLDHIRNDGFREKKRGYNDTELRKMIKDDYVKYKLQLLCANCNWIKRFERNETRLHSI